MAESLVVNYHLESLTQLEIDPMTHNIDIITQTRDKIALLLNIIHISGFLEARFTVQILHHILLDLLPSNQSMNTIIGVFLDENHPNVALIGWLMYKVELYDVYLEVFVVIPFSSEPKSLMVHLTYLLHHHF